MNNENKIQDQELNQANGGMCEADTIYCTTCQKQFFIDRADTKTVSAGKCAGKKMIYQCPDCKTWYNLNGNKY